MFGSYLRYLCLFTYIVVSNTYCIALLFLFVFVLCTLCCQFFWIVHFWLPLQHSLTFIQVYNTKFVFLKLYISDFSRWNHGLDYQSGALAIHVVSLTKSHHHVHNSSALVVYIPSKESTLHVDFFAYRCVCTRISDIFSYFRLDDCVLEYQNFYPIFVIIFAYSWVYWQISVLLSHVRPLAFLFCTDHLRTITKPLRKYEDTKGITRSI